MIKIFEKNPLFLDLDWEIIEKSIIIWKVLISLNKSWSRLRNTDWYIAVETKSRNLDFDWDILIVETNFFESVEIYFLPVSRLRPPSLTAVQDCTSKKYSKNIKLSRCASCVARCIPFCDLGAYSRKPWALKLRSWIFKACWPPWQSRAI